MINIAVTGGSGFIGIHLVNKLLKLGYNVTIIDTTKPPLHKFSNYGNKLKFSQVSILDFNELNKSFAGIKLVYHLAGVLGVQMSEQKTIKTLDTNILGTRNVMEAAKENKVKKVIFSSSSEVYGSGIRLPMNEDDAPSPISLYGASKLAAEYYCIAYSYEHKTKVVICRLFNFIGPYQRTDFVVPIFIRNAIDNKNLKIYGDGKQFRCFTYVKDGIRGLLSAGLTPNVEGIFNIGSNEITSMKSLAELIIKLTNSNSSIKFVELPSYRKGREIISRIPDIRKAKRDLNFEVEYNLETTLKEIIEWFKGCNLCANK